MTKLDEIIREMFGHRGPMRATGKKVNYPLKKKWDTKAFRQAIDKKPVVRVANAELTCADCGRPLDAPRCDCDGG